MAGIESLLVVATCVADRDRRSEVGSPISRSGNQDIAVLPSASGQKTKISPKLLVLISPPIPMDGRFGATQLDRCLPRPACAGCPPGKEDRSAVVPHEVHLIFKGRSWAMIHPHNFTVSASLTTRRIGFNCPGCTIVWRRERTHSKNTCACCAKSSRPRCSVGCPIHLRIRLINITRHRGQTCLIPSGATIDRIKLCLSWIVQVI